MRYAGRVMRKRGVVIVVSDFVMTHPDHVWEPALAQLSRRHDVVAVCLRDARETSIVASTQSAIVQWGGSERGDVLLADERISRIQQDELEAERQQMLTRLRQCGCDAVMITTDDDWAPTLVGLFQAASEAAMIRAPLALVLAIAVGVLALNTALAEEPTATVQIVPDGELTVGDPVEVRITLTHEAGDRVLTDGAVVQRWAAWSRRRR